MTVFSKKIKSGLLASLFLLLPVSAACAEERTAGTMPVSGATAKAEEAPAAKPAQDETVFIPEEDEDDIFFDDEEPVAVEIAKPAPAHADFEKLESYGLLSNVSDGGLGIDVWQGSKKGFLVSILEKMPPSSGYRTTQDLVRRALLTKHDVSLMKSGGSKPAAGDNDFLTVRIEKLTEMGDFAEAVKLYTENPDKPYSERLARAGILAMMLNGQTALACLEAKALGQDYEQIRQWEQIFGVCDYFMRKAGDDEKPVDGESSYALAGMVQQVVEKSRFRYTIQSPEDFEKLGYLDKATLINEKRMDYSSLKSEDFARFSAVSMALFMRDGTLPDAQKTSLLAYRAARGLDSAESLASFYESVFFAGIGKKTVFSLEKYAGIGGWKRLPYLYNVAESGDKSELQEAVSNALNLKDQYGISSLLPFAPYLDSCNPAEMPGESIRTALQLYALAGRKAPEKWLEKWASVKTGSTSDKLLQLAYGIAVNTPMVSSGNAGAISGFPELAGGAGQQILNMLKEKLDKTEKLHKDASSEPYEKNLDLTFGVGYVMPSVGLIDNLEEAEQDRRLGEVILLSSIALNEVPPAKMYAGLLQKVIDGLETVGLTKEARELATEVVLGISEKKKEN